jgi:hypothetical protein
LNNAYQIEFFNTQHECIGTILLDMQPLEQVENMLAACYPNIIYRYNLITL